MHAQLWEMAERHKEELRALDQQRLEATARAVATQEELLALRAKEGEGGAAGESEEARSRREADEAELARLRAELASARQQQIREELAIEQARIDEMRMVVEQDDAGLNAVAVDVELGEEAEDESRAKPVDVGEAETDKAADKAEGEGEEAGEGGAEDEAEDEAGASGELVRELNVRELQLLEEIAQVNF